LLSLNHFTVPVAIEKHLLTNSRTGRKAQRANRTRSDLTVEP
jgi:hypothetical protein